MEESGARYALKPDPYSSHSIVADWLGAGRGRRLLDVGAADGFLSCRFTEQGWKVTAIERDPALAARAGAHCERVIVADLERELPSLDGPFDAIVYADVLEHLTDPLRALRALNGALAADGTVALSLPNIGHLWVRLSLLAGRFDYAERGILDRTHLRFFTERSLRALVADAGLTVVRATATPVPLYQVIPDRWQGGWLARVHAAGAMAARVLPRLLGYQFVLLAHRRRDAGMHDGSRSQNSAEAWRARP